ncbi:M56 family metallopeptidase [Luteimonas vadosa]|uniref:Peptidase M56 domain-containing protein n=1 Tax=Luteimonas vadosa TaxID=1165507 RepID=A0ABP9E7C4_9GAMM
MHDPSLLVHTLGRVLADFLWQGALIGATAWLWLAVLRHARPQARYAVACAALLACVLVPGWQLVRALEAAGTAPLATIVDGSASASIAHGAGVALPLLQGFSPPPSPAPDVLPWIVAFWGAGVVVLGLRMACGLRWVGRLRTSSREADLAWQRRFEVLVARMGVRRPIALRVIAEGDSPLAAGWWKPVVLLPAALVLRMPSQLLEALVAHELAHVRRHDYLVNMLQGVVEVLLFYHPVTWWLSRRIRIEREQVADDIAASALGDPRRLALALSELDRHATSVPRFAQSAQGGLLMSRIRQLIQPIAPRPNGGLIALCVLGLVAGGFVFAQTPPAPPIPPAPPAPAAISPLHAAPPAPPAPPASPATPVLPAPPAPPPPPPAPASPAPPAPDAIRHAAARHGSDRGFALVREGQEGIAMSGTLDDVEAIRAARRGIDADFLWFRRDGRAYVVRDPELVARAGAAWAPTDALDARMQELDARMRPHQRKMDALARRMDALHVDSPFDEPAAREAAAQLEALGKQMEPLAREQAALSRRLPGADRGEAAELERKMEALAARQERLGAQMERHGRVLEAASRRMEAQAAPMAALGRQMEEAAKPMESIGKDMEALGAQIERKAAVAERQVQALIDEAMARGLATPAPARQ